MNVSTARSAPAAHVPRRVAVASNLRLVEETVAAALAGTGHRVARVPWPREGEPSALATLAPEVAVIVCASAGEQAVAGVRDLLAGYSGASLVVAGARPGPVWGGLIEAGADAVMTATTSIDGLMEAIETLARGEQVVGFVERQALLRQWFALRADRMANRGRLAQLTPREREVLDLLHRGSTTAMIAERLQISQTTVRSQVRAVLRKLGVRSQLAAVAVLDATLDATFDSASADP